MRYKVKFEGLFPIADGDRIVCQVGNLCADVNDGWDEMHDFSLHRSSPSVTLSGTVQMSSIDELTAALEKDYYLNPSAVPDTFIRIGEALLRVQIMPVNLGQWDSRNVVETGVRMLVQDVSAFLPAERLGKREALPA